MIGGREGGGRGGGERMGVVNSSSPLNTCKLLEEQKINKIVIIIIIMYNII